MIEFYTIALLAFLAAASPGPDFVVVAKHALTYNRVNAMLASLGIGVGILIHATYCVLGLALIISQSLLLFSMIKYMGAAYLIYLGVKSLLSSKTVVSKDISEKAPVSKWYAFRDGLLTNVLNPKCTLFMLSVFTLVINPGTSTFTQALYGVEISLVAVVWFIFLSVSMTLPFVKAKITPIQHVVSKAIGGLLIALGVFVIFESKSM